MSEYTEGGYRILTGDFWINNLKELVRGFIYKEDGRQAKLNDRALKLLSDQPTNQTTLLADSHQSMEEMPRTEIQRGLQNSQEPADSYGAIPQTNNQQVNDVPFQENMRSEKLQLKEILTDVLEPTTLVDIELLEGIYNAISVYFTIFLIKRLFVKIKNDFPFYFYT